MSNDVGKEIFSFFLVFSDLWGNAVRNRIFYMAYANNVAVHLLIAYVNSTICFSCKTLFYNEFH